MNENIQKLLKDSEAHMLITDNGVSVHGTKLTILTLISMLSENLKKNGFGEEELKRAFELGFKTQDELENLSDKLNKEIDDEIDKLNELFGNLFKTKEEK